MTAGRGGSLNRPLPHKNGIDAALTPGVVAPKAFGAVLSGQRRHAECIDIFKCAGGTAHTQRDCSNLRVLSEYTRNSRWDRCYGRFSELPQGDSIITGPKSRNFLSIAASGKINWTTSIQNPVIHPFQQK